jgi:hypothetical protein
MIKMYPLEEWDKQNIFNVDFKTSEVCLEWNLRFLIPKTFGMEARILSVFNFDIVLYFSCIYLILLIFFPIIT